jgi:hypothetical protein
MIRQLSPGIQALTAIYTGSSLLHFVHNAEYIVFYPGMPAGLTREHVYLVWLAIAAFGAAGLAFARWGWPVAAGLSLAAYGAFGLDGLAHYTLALCSEHTLAMNLTIAFEAVAGAVLAVACLRQLRRGGAPFPA